MKEVEINDFLDFIFHKDFYKKSDPTTEVMIFYDSKSGSEIAIVSGRDEDRQYFINLKFQTNGHSK